MNTKTYQNALGSSLWTWGSILLTSSVLVACGGSGGGSSSATASDTSQSNNSTVADTTNTVPTLTAAEAGTAAAIGSVTGFGSIIVDGVTYDDSEATVQVEKRPGQKSLGSAKLGQRVVLSLRADGKLGSVELLPESSGTVTAVNTTAGSLVVNSQTIVINTDSTVAAVTAYGGGYTSLADVKVGDSIEVHGVQTTDSAGASVIRATRIEKRVAADSVIRASGYVQNLAAGTSFKLGGLTVTYTGVTPAPAGSVLANGTYVMVMGSTPVTGSSMTADKVRVITPKSVLAAEVVSVSGVISNYNATTTSFTINGLTVNAASATVTPTGATLANGYAVRVAGSINATTGALDATTIETRDRSKPAAPPVRLKGSITNFVSLADFTVRGVAVDGSTATLTSCPSTGLATGQYVDLQGTISTTTSKVTATSLTCYDASSLTNNAIVSRQGTVISEDTTNKTFVLQLSGGTSLTVKFVGRTHFDRDLTITTLTGKSVVVEGRLLSDGTFEARHIELQGSSS